MVKQTVTNLTFALTLPQPKGKTIPEVRALIIASLKHLETEDIKCHLTNKEVKYGA